MIITSEELMILADMTGHKELFGFPELSFYRMNAAMFVEKGIHGLKEKNWLDEAGHLTEKGWVMASLVEKYGDGEQFVCMGKTDYVALLEECIVLIREEAGYQLQLFSPQQLLTYWYTQYSVLRRDIPEAELQFRKKRSPLTFSELQPNIEAVLHLGSIVRTKTAVEKEEFFLFTANNCLYHLEEQRVRLVSQYWVNKWLINKLKIPYEVPQERGEQIGK